MSTINILDYKVVKGATTKPCFSNGYEFDRWTAHNCDKCCKSSKLKEDGEYTAIICAIQRDIIRQLMGEMQINKRSYRITQHDTCPQFSIRKMRATRNKCKPEPSQQIIFNFTGQ